MQGWTLELALQKSWEGAADMGPDQDRFDPSRWLAAKASRSPAPTPHSSPLHLPALSLPRS